MLQSKAPRMPGQIEHALHDALLKQARLPSSRESFYASSLHMCPRKQVAERAGLPATQPPDMRGYFKMGVGTVVGQWAQKLLAEQGYLDPDWTERRFVYRSYVGKIDGYTPIENAIVEIKTSDDDAITRYPDVPEHYLWQSLFYALASGIPKVILFQLGKNQGLTRSRELYLDSDWKAKLEEEITILEVEWAQYLQTGVLPDHDHRYKWEDKLCAFGTPKTAVAVGNAKE